MKRVLVLCAVSLLAGCQGANVTSQIRESGETGSSKMIRCTALNTGSEQSVNDDLKQYDGWKMVYASEYTTANKSNTAAVMCFEKPYK
ncbi:MAG: hypothetical protein IPK30_05025 [Cellvibrionales bacterium]|jgi:hypothetical protein|nr:hypothetical protein [Cellvibrionales bacterium]